MSTNITWCCDVLFGARVPQPSQTIQNAWLAYESSNLRGRESSIFVLRAQPGRLTRCILVTQGSLSFQSKMSHNARRVASFFYGVAAFSSLVNARASTGVEAPLITASARAFFIFDTHPTGTLEASIIAYNRENATYHVAYPTADAVYKKEGYWPATVTHIEGSSWIGINTATAGIEKQWRCRLGSGSDVVNVIPDQYGQCFITTVDAAGSTTVDPDMPIDTCFLSAHSVVVAVTAGLEKVKAIHPIITQGEVASYGDLCDVRKSGTVYRIGIWETYDWGNGKRVVTGRDGRRRDDRNGNQVGDRRRYRDGDGTGSTAVASTSAPASGSGRTSGGFSLVLGAVAAGLAAFL
ncbi:hypothetical protein LZ30DRAFT_820101 [Colletotrichum cereale]|nr:hypothetical protein LZ30DRAFT_820101 [Colletotrichum cereale]